MMPEVLLPFHDADRSALAAFAFALHATSDARSVEAIARNLAAGGTPHANSSDALRAKYGEVALLFDMLELRIAARDAMRDLSSGGAVGDVMWRGILARLQAVASRLPDPVFVHLGFLVEAQLCAATKHEPLGQSQLLVELHEVLIRIQEEVLQNSKKLTVRSPHITINFRETFPFCLTI